MKAVALVGFSDVSRERWRELPGEVPIWTVNCAWFYGIERIDRLFELHPVERLEENAALCEQRIAEFGAARMHYEAEHWRWLQSPHPFRVTMLEADERIQHSERYPIEEVVQAFGREAFSSTMDYLLALAIYEGYQKIHLIGVEMGSETEYAYQKPNFLYWMGQAEGRGVELVLPEGCGLLPRRMYGYEDYQMISRQTLEYHLADYKNQLENAMGTVNLLEGVLAERRRALAVEKVIKRKDDLKAAIAQAQKEQQQARQVMWGVRGAIQATEHLIKFCDVGEGKVLDEVHS